LTENIDYPLNIKYSIIIPVKAINNYIRQTVGVIAKIKRSDLEVIILPNELESNSTELSHLRIIETGRIGPAEKRDIGAVHSKGQILVFLDDDSYPNLDFLDYSDEHFRDDSVVALGGPGITPKEASFWERVSGGVFLSRFSGGAPERYIPCGKVREVDDWPSVNLMVRRKEFLEIGGFDTDYWPGEDTKLCLNLLAKTNKRILYVPQMMVWHHRRIGIFKHLKQVGSYGLHRGFFIRSGDVNSRKIKYFFPAMLVLYMILTCIIFLTGLIGHKLLLLLWLPYFFALFAAFIDISKIEGIFVAAPVIAYTVLSHLYYGLRFIQGLFTSNLKSSLR
jgi:GT2 family glycosyltransferase